MLFSVSHKIKIGLKPQKKRKSWIQTEKFAMSYTPNKNLSEKYLRLGKNCFGGSEVLKLKNGKKKT